jgi:hypothetical protein
MTSIWKSYGTGSFALIDLKFLAFITLTKIVNCAKDQLSKVKTEGVKWKKLFFENNLKTESKFELIQNKLDFVRNKYELSIK